MPQGQRSAATPDTLDRRLPEDSVEYFLFVVDENLDFEKQSASLKSLCQDAVDFAQILTKDYIWQRDGFQLSLLTGHELQYLHGATAYGDAVEDEWLIVYMLQELTQTHENIWVQISDTDGEFLLIEAASVLPSWLRPENDRNRVWIHHGKLFIIPCAEDSRSLSLSESVAFLRSQPENLIHSPFIQSEAFYRLEKYPKQIEDSMHVSLITIPRKLAFLLHELPNTVSAAVESFYLRDPISVKSLWSTSKPLDFPLEDLVTTGVRFSKVLFAQVKSQRFEPPPRWQRIMQEALSSSSSQYEETWARLELGMKLTCGFEMLVGQAKKKHGNVHGQGISRLLENIESREAALPTNQEMEAWKDCKRNDDEAWMNISFEDFDRELDGKISSHSPAEKTGLDSAQSQTDLRKIVSRFEAFLNDDSAGLDGAELGNKDDESHDDREAAEITDDENDEYEDKVVSFDEQAFSQMMRQMMGLPASEPQTATTTTSITEISAQTSTAAGRRTDKDSQIRDVSLQMETELKYHGALHRDTTLKERYSLKGEGQETSPLEQTFQVSVPYTTDPDSDDEVQDDYNLARNLLESFKSQAGMAGPTGNLLGMMGFQLPRDEVEDDENECSR